MPSSFDDRFETLATPHLVGEFGEAVTYRVNAVETPLTGVVFDEVIDEEAVAMGRASATLLPVEIGRDGDADRGGIEHPRLDAQLKVRGVWYAVKSIREQSAYSTTLNCTRVESLEKSRPGYRGR